MKRVLKRCLEKEEVTRYNWIELALDPLFLNILSGEGKANLKLLEKKKFQVS